MILLLLRSRILIEEKSKKNKKYYQESIMPNLVYACFAILAIKLECLQCSKNCTNCAKDKFNDKTNAFSFRSKKVQYTDRAE